MDTRASTRTRFSVLPVLIALLFNVLVAAPVALVAADSASALDGSAFDATDGNLVVDGDERDWCTPGLGVVTQTDLPTGQNDDSYAEGAKEDDANPPVETGSIPNNKVDLKRVYVTGETGAFGDLFVHVGWVRGDDNGTGTISFELNQSGVRLSNGVNNQRTVGDLLVTFNFGGGQFESLTVRTWDGDSWENEVDLVENDLGEGSVNEGTISDCLAGVSLGDALFGEFSINLTKLIGGDCRAFASIFAKSRASNAIESKLKELIKPTGIDLSTCGQITILKQDEGQQPLGGATFSVTPNPFTSTGSLSVTDNVAPDDNAAAGTIHLSDVEPGDYTVCETAAPAGYIIDATCRVMTVGVNGSATFGPFVNGLGDISWTKVDLQSGAKICCATFTLVGTAGAAVGFSLTVTDNDPMTDADPDAGELLVLNLKLGTYRITETVPPVGYNLPSPAFQDVVLSGQTASAAAAFQDAPRADAHVAKSAVLSPVVAGQPASFTVTVTAGGTGASEGVVLTDVNNTGRAWTVTGADAAACADTSVAAGETLTCSFGTLANGASRTVTITMSSSASDCANGIANTAVVASTNDHDASNNQASATITVLCPNPGVTKSSVASPIVFGQDAAFTVTVTAGGGSAATNVVLTDDNDTGHDWVVSGAGSSACADLTVADGETLTCTWASIPAGESRVVTITMKSDAGDCAEGISNTASISADADVDQSNNQASASISVLCPDPNVSKDAVLTPITAGDSAAFSITVNAGGTGAASNVTLTDVNETDHAWTVSGADAAACGMDLTIEPGDSLVCTWASIPAGGSRVVTITMTSDAADCADGIANTASITADADVDPNDNSDSASIEVLCPDLEIDKAATEPVVNAGESASYTITVSNADGDAEARDVTISDDLPDGLTWTEDSADCVIDVDGNLLCEDLTIDAGDSFSVAVTGTTDSGDCPSILNRAGFTSSNGGSGSSHPEGQGAQITVNCPDVTLDKEPVTTPISAGEQAQFTITVTNNGPGTAYDVVVTDRPPAGTVWTVLTVDGEGVSCDDVVGGGSQVITCMLESLEPGSENAVTITIGYDTTAADCGTLLNAARVRASNETQANQANNGDSATIVVECPGLNVLKQADEDPIDAGEEASFTITIWNAGPGDAFDVALDDDLPTGLAWDFELLDGPEGVTEDDCSMASSLVLGGEQSMSIHCEFGTLEPSDMEDGIVIRVFAQTDRTDCGLLENTAEVTASNLQEMADLLGLDETANVLTSTDTITVRCAEIALDKANDAVGSVLPGTTVQYTLTLTVSDDTVANGVAEDVVVVDELPVGLENPTNISDGGTFDATARTITWSLGDLVEGSYGLTYDATVADDVENGGELVNAAAATSTNSQCPDLETLGPECEDDSTVEVRVPTLVIDKVANAEMITISGPANAPVATPSVVTWTLTYTLANGPVTNAVITDEVPVGFTFLDAANGGTFADGTVTWNLGTLSASGSVSFRTTVNVATISRTAPTVNIAVIDSAETEPDDGTDSVTVTVQPPPLGGTPTPRPLPNTATGIGLNGEPVTVPVELLVAFLFLGSLGTLALANVKARSRRR